MAVAEERILRFITIGGVFILYVPLGIYWYWGNLSVYVLSYYQRQDPNTQDNTSWVLLAHSILRSGVFFISGHFIRVLGLRKTVFIGIVLFNGGIITNIFTLQYAMWTFTLTLGVLSGFGSGMIFASVFYSAVQWSDETTVGHTIAFVQCGVPFGAIVMNQLTTVFLNPRNEKADSLQHGHRFFTQNAILNRVPVLFIGLGVLFAIQLLGLSLLRNKQGGETYTEADDQSSLGGTSQSSTASYSSNDDAEKALDYNNHERSGTDLNYTPLQMLRCPTFYVLTGLSFLNEVFSLISANYYKSFGQLWIRDDYFLTGIGIAMVVAMVLSRYVCGVALDRCGVKNTFTVGFAIIGVCCAFFYVAAVVNRWFYLVVVVVMGSLTGAFDIAMAVAAVVYFGRLHSVANTGLLIFLSLSPVLLVTQVFNIFISSGRWSLIFFSGSCLALVCVLLTICFYLENSVESIKY